MVTRTGVLIPIAAAAVIVGIFGMLTLPTDVKLESVEFPIGTIKLDDKILEVQIAETVPQHARGLMFESAMSYDQGMLFVFDNPGLRPMWMMSMYFNIDIIWFDENLNIVSIEKNVPKCETAWELMVCKENGVSADNAKYVLEVTAGFVDEFNITDKSKLELISI